MILYDIHVHTQLVCDSANSVRNSRCRSVVKSASCKLQLRLTVPVPAGSRSRIVTSDARPTRGRSRQLKNTHNSVTIENMIHIYVKIFVHEDLRNHLLQYCPQVMYHSVYVCVCVFVCVCVCACVFRPIYKGKICCVTCQAVTDRE